MFKRLSCIRIRVARHEITVVSTVRRSNPQHRIIHGILVGLGIGLAPFVYARRVPLEAWRASIAGVDGAD